MRILVVHASSHGQTRKIAEAIAQRLRQRGHEVELGDAMARAPALPPPEDYDAVVLGSRIQAGSHAPALVEYAVRHRAALAAMPTAFFSVSMAAATAGAGPDPAGYLERMFRIASWRPRRAVAFAGALRYRRYNPFLRWFMKLMSRRNGHPTDTSRDHELTDWDAVARFADAIADDLAAGSFADDAALTVPLPVDPAA
jgi:menaquinone-dependent protoporphyrinogen oxidase